MTILIGLVLTEKAYENTSNSTEVIESYAEYVENQWNSHYSNDKYEINVLPYPDEEDTISVDVRRDIVSARINAEWKIKEYTNLLDILHGVHVVDSYMYENYNGYADVGSLNTQDAVSISSPPSSNATQHEWVVAHEIGHLCGGKHPPGPSTFSSTELHHSIMGKYGVEDCSGSTSYTPGHGEWYSDCTIEDVKDLVDQRI